MEPIVHFFIPVLFLLAFFPEKKRLILLLSPLTLVMELDWFLSHRAILHNIFFALIVSAVVYYVSKKNKTVFYIALFYLSSHLLLDINGVGLFYPFYDKLISIDFMVYSSPRELSANENISFKTLPITEMNKPQVSPVVTMLGVILVLLALVFSTVKVFQKTRPDI